MNLLNITDKFLTRIDNQIAAINLEIKMEEDAALEAATSAQICTYQKAKRLGGFSIVSVEGDYMTLSNGKRTVRINRDGARVS